VKAMHKESLLLNS